MSRTFKKVCQQYNQILYNQNIKVDTEIWQMIPKPTDLVIGSILISEKLIHLNCNQLYR